MTKDLVQRMDILKKENKSKDFTIKRYRQLLNMKLKNTSSVDELGKMHQQNSILTADFSSQDELSMKKIHVKKNTMNMHSAIQESRSFTNESQIIFQDQNSADQ